ncbi:CCA tRNA nucleotidyltransferase 1, mitochondrial isoform X2 [Cimex lectularius]|nr:CCA tRNA nucleotidyltransferase 1, mitochondrial isoform X2 [Cimex lectularius]
MKVNSEEFKSLFTDGFKKLVEIFDKNGFEIRIAGGAVRDLLLGIAPKDVDFASTATPDQMKTFFNKEEIRMINMKGEKHGTITARICDENFEITTLRVDMVTDGRHAEVQFTKDWELDANRRDLTINSMFLGVDGTLFDYFNGYDDLLKRRVVFVGDPRKRIQEDYLRILRYFRFYGRIAELPNDHNEDTIKAISENVVGLEKISGERIWQEVSKILSGNFVSPIVQKMIQVGVHKYIGLPEKPNVSEMIKVYEMGKHFNLHPISLISSLLYNEEDVFNFHKRCRLSLFEQELSMLIVQERDTPNEFHYYQEMVLKASGKSDKLSKQLIEFFKYKCNLDLLSELQCWQIPKFPVSGVDLKKEGVPHGKSVGKVLTDLRQIWIDSNFKYDKKTLLNNVPAVAGKHKINLSKSAV